MSPWRSRPSATRPVVLVAAQIGSRFLHDVGKIGVPDAVLLKPARLNGVELMQMQQHPLIGDALCGHLRSLRSVRPIVRHHHERPDGSGYPDGLRGDEIPLLASIVSVVDAYDALTTARSYKAAFTRERACRELRDEAQRGWKHEKSVEAWIDVVRSGVIDVVSRDTALHAAGAADGGA